MADLKKILSKLKDVTNENSEELTLEELEELEGGHNGVCPSPNSGCPTNNSGCTP
ncbi:hypothetical protein MUK70_25545 [Dyadobacter chenwenxiniae]|uniref:Uncharacterized protein n=1 Tax=Dyadobacter chenwenxiniae TaxID=2906456 RepID=A0A9X1TH63_9BACT|nr:hypothetical protein [Dyadobacter chenwenxiniae]MCF0064405.1 hypothetical protein [Dyadobacter chenwenxiniae]UON82390.1 hypothetical protein MUK70_25545 [Dyadobacter chenwenxiniae]